MIYENAYDRIETPTVLIADNDDEQRRRIAGYLRRNGYGVLEAKTGVEGLLLAVEYPFRIDGLFTSLALRKYCNGSELAACLQATRPGMAVFYLGDMHEAGDEAAKEIVTGEALLLAPPVQDPRLAEAADLIEERRDAEMTASRIGEWP